MFQVVKCMNRAPLTYRMLHWAKEQRALIRKIERDFHVRAFGEELARVNLDMTKEERHQYLEWMRQWPGRMESRRRPAGHMIWKNPLSEGDVLLT